MSAMLLDIKFEVPENEGHHLGEPKTIERLEMFACTT